MDRLSTELNTVGWQDIRTDERQSEPYTNLILLAHKACSNKQLSINEAILERMENSLILLSLHAGALFEAWAKTRQSGPIVALRNILDEHPSLGWHGDHLKLVFSVDQWAMDLVLTIHKSSPQDLLESLLDASSPYNLKVPIAAPDRTANVILWLAHKFPAVDLMAQMEELLPGHLKALGMAEHMEGYKRAKARAQKLDDHFRRGHEDRPRRRP